MSDLNVFLNPIKPENVKYAASERFVVGKTPVEWEIKTLTAEEDETLRKNCKKQVPIPGKYGQYTLELDSEKYIAKLASVCTIYPNLKDAKLQDFYHVMGEESLLKAMLLPGEYARYVEKIQQVNGFTKSIDELVNDAKN